MNETKTRTNGPVQEQVETARPARVVVLTPQVDILELPEELVLQLDLPGVKAEDVEVNFERGELTVKGKRPAVSRGGGCLVEELEFGDYYRAFLISQDIAADKIAAELKNGVLTVHLPRASSALPRRIAVKNS